MSEFLKFLFEQATDPLTLPINPVAEWIVLLFINELVYRMAYGLVGDLYSSECISGSTAGKLIHWFLRTICFYTVWAVANVIIVVGQFIINNWLAILLGLLLLIGLWLVWWKLHQKTSFAA